MGHIRSDDQIQFNNTGADQFLLPCLIVGNSPCGTDVNVVECVVQVPMSGKTWP